MAEKNTTKSGEPEGLKKEIEALKTRMKEFEDVADMMPLISNFREHLDEEREKNRARLVTMAWCFVAIGLVLLLVPVYLASRFSREIETYQNNQAKLEIRLQESFSSDLAAIQKSTILLIRELAQDRKSVYDALNSTAEALNKLTAVQVQPVAVPPASPPPEVKAVEPEPAKPEPEPVPSPKQPVKAPIITPEPEAEAAPVGQIEPARDGDLKVERGRLSELLNRVDQALEERKEFRKELLQKGETVTGPDDDPNTPKG